MTSECGKDDLNPESPAYAAPTVVILCGLTVGIFKSIKVAAVQHQHLSWFLSHSDVIGCTSEYVQQVWADC